MGWFNRIVLGYDMICIYDVLIVLPAREISMLCIMFSMVYRPCCLILQFSFFCLCCFFSHALFHSVFLTQFSHLIVEAFRFVTLIKKNFVLVLFSKVQVISRFSAFTLCHWLRMCDKAQMKMESRIYIFQGLLLTSFFISLRVSIQFNWLKALLSMVTMTTTSGSDCVYVSNSWGTFISRSGSVSFRKHQESSVCLSLSLSPPPLSLTYHIYWF